MNAETIIYKTDDGLTEIETKFDGDSIWITMDQMAKLFGEDRATVLQHVRGIFTEGELRRDLAIANFATALNEDKTQLEDYYNLDVVISAGRRIKSLYGTHFQIWAINTIKEYLKKGSPLSYPGSNNYFKELLEHIRSIRSTGKVFYRQILDIYATSIDYNPKATESIKFFRAVQSKIHHATYSETAAEIIDLLAYSDKYFMGLTFFENNRLRKTDSLAEDTYLGVEEIKILNMLVAIYLDYAELQALKQKPVYMKDWILKFGDFIRMDGSDLRKHAGIISHEKAKIEAEIQYEKYKDRNRDHLTQVEKDFIEHVKRN